MSTSREVVTRTVTGTYMSSSGVPRKGRVIIEPTRKVVDGSNSVVVPEPISVHLDDQGSFSVELPTTDNPRLTPSEWTYVVRVRLVDVAPQTLYLRVPYGDGQPIELLALDPMSPTDAEDEWMCEHRHLNPKGSQSCSVCGDISVQKTSRMTARERSKMMRAAKAELAQKSLTEHRLNHGDEIPECPTCRSRNVQALNLAMRGRSALLGGFLFSRRARAHFTCKACGYNW